MAGQKSPTRISARLFANKLLRKEEIMKKLHLRRTFSVILTAVMLSMSLSGCVNQYPDEDKSQSSSNGSKYLVEDSKALAKAPENPRIVAVSAATCDIMERLDLDLVGRPTQMTTALPERYMNDSDIKDIGSPMSPDIEIIKSLNPDYVIGPATLQPAFESQFQSADLPYLFINLKSVQGLYKSVEQLGSLFGKEKEAQKEIDEYNKIMSEYKAKHSDREGPTVLILMGVPGAYIVATPNSYVGNLVELAGGRNVYSDETDEFIQANTEDMEKRDPDIILRCAHAMPDVVKDMFAKEFATNDIWKHFRAVKEGKVYDLTYNNFGMSAKFNWPDALEELEPYLYPDEK